MTCDKVFERVITETSDTSLEDNSSLHIPVNDSIILSLLCNSLYSKLSKGKPVKFKNCCTKRLFLTGSDGAQSSAAFTATRCNDHSMQRRVASLCCRVGSVAAERLPIIHFYWVREPGPADCFLGIAAPPWGRNTAQQYRLWPERRDWTSRDRITEYLIWALTYQVDNVLNFFVLRLMSGLDCFHWNPSENDRNGFEWMVWNSHHPWSVQRHRDTDTCRTFI